MSVVKRLEIQGWSSGWCYDVKKFELWVLYLMLLVAEAGHHSIVFSSFVDWQCRMVIQMPALLICGDLMPKSFDMEDCRRTNYLCRAQS